MASLSLSVTNTGSNSYNLSSLGTADWIAYPATTAVRKSGGGSLISVGHIGSFTDQLATDGNDTVTWTDGAGTTSGNTHNVVFSATGAGIGYSATFPADTNARTAYIVAGGYGSTINVTAVLSDGSATQQTGTIVWSSGGGVQAIIRIDYVASSTTTLVVSLVQASTGSYSNTSFQAAALTQAVQSNVYNISQPAQQMRFADRLQFTSSGTSAALITVGGSVQGYRTLAQAISQDAGLPNAIRVGDTNVRFVVYDSSGNWEAGLYTINSTTQITQTQRKSSSNNSLAVTFNGSGLTVYNDIFASDLARMSIDSDVAFSTIVPLTQVGTAWMPQQTVNSALAFSPAAGAVKGAYAFVRLIADGVTAPTFPGFTEEVGSAGYVNRAGVVNKIQFQYDGYDYWYSVAQAASIVPIDTTAPTITSAVVASGALSMLVLTASEPLDQNNVPSASAFTVGGHTITGVTLGTNTVNLALSAAFVSGEAARTVSYTQPGSSGLRDVAGNLMASFSGMAVTNNAPAAAGTAIRLSPRSSDLSESSTAPWVYTGTGAPYSDAASNYVPYAIGGVATQKLQSGQDGSLSFKFSTTGSEFMLGLSTSASVVGFNNLTCAFYMQGTSGKYTPFLSSSSNPATATNSVGFAVGDIMRLRRSGTSVIAEVSKDSGSTWSTIYTWTGISTSAIYFQCVVGTGAGAISNLTGVGLA